MAERREHLDSKLLRHHDVFVRTTVTLDQDVERLLKEEMHRKRASFKEVLNGAVRAGLGRLGKGGKRKEFVIKARALGLRTGIDPMGLNKLNDEMEMDGFLSVTRRLESDDRTGR